MAQGQGHDRRTRLLVVGPDEPACARLRGLLHAVADARFEVEEALTYEEGLGRLLCGGYDVGLIAHALSPRDGLALIREAGGRGCVTPLILLGPRAEMDEGALLAGADECLCGEQLTPEGLGRAIRWTLMRARRQPGDRTRHLIVATAIHDLRGPLSAIFIRAQMLAQRLSRCVAVEQARTLSGEARAIDVLAHKMARQIGGMADVWRECLGRPLEIQRGAMDLIALARAEIESAAVPTHPIRLLAEDREIMGCWDGERLGRVVENLLANAIKYSPAGGEILVRVDRRGPWAFLQVEDHGIGIPAADLPEIGQFCRRGGNAVGRFVGSGIGLFGARLVVEEHGGDLSVDSIETAGTTVTVRLPLS